MSKASPTARFISQNRDIPSRRVILSDPSQLPHDYSTTPGGTIFSTTPGGTRIIYDRQFLMKCKQSPLAKSPPANMAKIPGVTSPGLENIAPNQENGHEESSATPKIAEEPQFEMDIWKTTTHNAFHVVSMTIDFCCIPDITSPKKGGHRLHARPASTASDFFFPCRDSCSGWYNIGNLLLFTVSFL